MQRTRQHSLDTLRGLTLISMIAFHGCWDLVYLYGRNWDWYRSFGAYVWQQSICWTFILLSGYCWQMGRNPMKRGLMAFFGGAVVSAVTLVIMPEEPILFGVLTFLGTAALLTIPLHSLFQRIPAKAGVIGSFALFFLLRNVNIGYLGFEKIRFCKLPISWYRNLFTAFLGFPAPSFISSDYFSLFPWLFLFWTGYFLYRLALPERIPINIKLPVISWMGRYSLVVYLLHQPILYVLCELFA